MRYLVNFQAKNFYDKKTFGLRLVSWGRGSRIYNRPSALAYNLGSSLSPTILAEQILFNPLLEVWAVQFSPDQIIIFQQGAQVPEAQGYRYHSH